MAAKKLMIPHVVETRRMVISIQDLNTASMKLTEHGLKLRLRAADKPIEGHLSITPDKLIWYDRDDFKHGTEITWPDFLDFMRRRPKG